MTSTNVSAVMKHCTLAVRMNVKLKGLDKSANKGTGTCCGLDGRESNLSLCKVGIVVSHPGQANMAFCLINISKGKKESPLLCCSVI